MGVLDFELLVDDALKTIPPELAERVVNVSVAVVADPPNGQRNLLGLYEGIPLTKRGPSGYAGVMPDRISIYRNNILRICQTPEEVVEQVRITVVHEIGHFFGIDDDRLHELGY